MLAVLPALLTRLDDAMASSKQPNGQLDGFGARLATLRQSRGLTQTEPGDAAGVSQRVIAYYETESTQPPGALLVNFARALRCTTDELLGVEPTADPLSPKTARLLKRLQPSGQVSPLIASHSFLRKRPDLRSGVVDVTSLGANVDLCRTDVGFTGCEAHSASAPAITTGTPTAAIVAPLTPRAAPPSVIAPPPPPAPHNSGRGHSPNGSL
jgi:transcriptional regulator with XRE-family HTH domain